MVFGMYQVDLDLKGRIGKQSQQMGFCGMLDGHNVQDHNPLGPDILVDGPGLVHDKYVLLFQNGRRRQIIGYIDGHNLALMIPGKNTTWLNKMK
jgi:hypothetical protein